jgi:hypothetical protein
MTGVRPRSWLSGDALHEGLRRMPPPKIGTFNTPISPNLSQLTLELPYISGRIYPGACRNLPWSYKSSGWTLQGNVKINSSHDSSSYRTSRHSNLVDLPCTSSKEYDNSQVRDKLPCTLSFTRQLTLERTESKTLLFGRLTLYLPPRSVF